jgi:predicted ATP-dependent serine protease
VRQLARKNALCPAEEHCPGRVFDCRKCGHEWRQHAEECPRCGADWQAVNVEHGPECAHSRMLEAAMESRRGGLIRRAIEVRSALRMGFTVGLDEVSAEEFAAMRILDEEFGRAGRDAV